MKKLPPKTPKLPSSSWESAHRWYNEAVGERGLYYHREIIFPGVLRLLNLNDSHHLLDLGCGNGIFSQELPPALRYTGVDLSPSLIKLAQKKYPKRTFFVGDITKPLSLPKQHFSHFISILSLQNLSDPFSVFKNCSEVLQKKGKGVFVLNHPCFRIPRHSSWDMEEGKSLQSRKIDHYLSPLSIPILTHPSQQTQGGQTWSFHFPLSAYAGWLQETGFAIATIEEWASNKKSTGKWAKREDRARLEIPLFCAFAVFKL
jgi:ubiquinone/menaquinone biosynthesis C-methylase UbiE